MSNESTRPTPHSADRDLHDIAGTADSRASTPTRRPAIFLLCLGMLCGCAAVFDKVPQPNMAPRLSYRGFSFDRPSSWDWYLLRSEEHYTDVTLRRDFWRKSNTHSFFANVSLGGIERQPETHEEFAELARSKGPQAPYSVRTVSYEQRRTTRQGQWCIRFDSSHVVRGAPPAPELELTMLMRGYRCLHPTWPKTTLDFFYSERGLADELDPGLAKEGEDFLNGVRIDVAPNTPAR